MAGTGKRKRESPSDAPGSSWPPPGSSWPRPPLRGAGNYEDDSSLSDYTEDSRSDRSYLSDSEDELYLSYPVADYAGGGDSKEESEIADLFDFFLSNPPAEAKVQPPPPPADHPAAAEVADRSVAEAAPSPEMVVPAAESVSCFGCGREPVLRLVPVEHVCFCQPCRSNPSRWSYCAFCDGPLH
nr:uncharacterized protein LOC127344250 [Lolium perenne]